MEKYLSLLNLILLVAIPWIVKVEKCLMSLRKDITYLLAKVDRLNKDNGD